MDIIKLDPFPNVPATGTAKLVTNQLVGMSVHAIVFEQGGTTFNKTHISTVRIGQGTKSYFPYDLSGSQLQDLNDYDGLSATTNYLGAWFGDPTARTIRGQHLGDLDCSIYRDPLEIEVKIAGATAPTLQCYAVVGVPKMAMGLGYTIDEASQVRALIRTVVQTTAAVVRKSEGIGLGSNAGASIRRIALFHDGDLTSVEFKKQGVTKHEDLSDALNDYIQVEFGRVPQANLYVVDRIVDGNQGEAEPTIQPDGKTPWNLQVLLTTSAALDATAYADVYTRPELL